MKLLVYGATGHIGGHIVAEALRRGHQVTIAFGEAGRPAPDPRVGVVVSKVTDADSVAAAAANHDAVISAIGPRTRKAVDVENIVKAAHALLGGLRQVPGVRLLVAGGAGSLEVAPGVMVIDTFVLADEQRAVPLAHKRALAVYLADNVVDWIVISPGPSGPFLPMGRTGKYRRAGEQALTDAKGHLSGISVEDLAVAFLDELENPQAHRQRIHVAY